MRLLSLISFALLLGGIFCTILHAQENIAPAENVPPLTEEASSNPDSNDVALRDLAQIQGVRSNQLLGYGLVVGLAGTGDSRSKFAKQAIRNLLGGLGQKADGKGLSETRNIAAVLVTAEVASFAKVGSRLSATVSSVGDASSIEGGILIQTPLYAGNKKIYAVAQGAITIGSRNSKRTTRKGRNTVGSLLNGVIVEKELQDEMLSSANNRRVRVSLRRFDFSTLYNMQQKIAKSFPKADVQLDGGAVLVDIPSSVEPVAFIAKMQDIRIRPRYPSRVIINERSGTIVMGGDVRVDAVAISRNGMNVQVNNSEKSSEEVDGTDFLLESESSKRKAITQEFSGGSVSELIRSLNGMGAGVKDIIAILEALKDSGALHADLIVN